VKLVTDARVAKFVGDRVDRTIYPPFTSLGIERGGEVVAGAVFNCYTGADIHLTAAGERFTRGFIRHMGRYVFDQLKCERMTVITEQPEVSALTIRLGGVIEGTLRNQFGAGRDGVILGILKGEYKYG